MESQLHQQLPDEDAKKQINAFLHRPTDDKLHNLLRSENDTLFDTKSLPNHNFYSVSYGAAGPSTATHSRSVSDSVFSAKVDAVTDVTSNAPSSKGKHPARKSVSSSVGANKGSSAEDGRTTSSDSDTDQAKSVSVKDVGGSFKPGEGRAARREIRRRPKLAISHGKLKLDPSRVDAHQYQTAGAHTMSTSDSDLEAHQRSKATVPIPDSPPWSYKTTMICLTIVASLLGLLATLLYFIVNTAGQHRKIINPILAVLLLGTISGSVSIIIMTHGENPRAARCAFTIGMVFASIIASMLALSIGRPNVECYLIMVAIVAFALLLRSEIETIGLLKWK